MKLCGRCGKTLSHLEFYRAKGSPDGLASYCRGCQLSAVQASRARIRQVEREAAEKMRRCALCQSLVWTRELVGHTEFFHPNQAVEFRAVGG